MRSALCRRSIATTPRSCWLRSRMLGGREPMEGGLKDGTALRYAGEFMRQDRRFVLEALRSSVID